MRPGTRQWRLERVRVRSLALDLVALVSVALVALTFVAVIANTTTADHGTARPAGTSNPGSLAGPPVPAGTAMGVRPATLILPLSGSTPQSASVPRTESAGRCPPHTSLASASGQCVAAPEVSCVAAAGARDGACTEPATASCPGGWAREGEICTRPADLVCSDGGPPADGQCVTATTWTCAPGWTLDDATCRARATPTCPAEWTMDGGTCVADTVWTCPGGGTLNGRTCVAPVRYVCDDGVPAQGQSCDRPAATCGTNWRLVGNQCVNEAERCTGVSEVDGCSFPVCSAPSSRFDGVGTCVAEARPECREDWPPSSQPPGCLSDATPTCPGGIVPDGAGRCVTSTQQVCRGMTDVGPDETGQCTARAKPTCAGNIEPEEDTGRCVAPPIETCASGQPTGGDGPRRCTRPVSWTCADGASPDAAHICSSTRILRCPAGTSLDGEMCVGPACPAGTLLAGTRECVPPVARCPSGTTRDGAGLCHSAPPGCPEGYTATSSGVCAQLVPACPPGTTRTARGLCRLPDPRPPRGVENAHSRSPAASPGTSAGSEAEPSPTVVSQEWPAARAALVGATVLTVGLLTSGGGVLLWRRRPGSTAVPDDQWAGAVSPNLPPIAPVSPRPPSSAPRPADSDEPDKPDEPTPFPNQLLSAPGRSRSGAGLFATSPFDGDRERRQVRLEIRTRVPRSSVRERTPAFEPPRLLLRPDRTVTSSAPRTAHPPARVVASRPRVARDDLVLLASHPVLVGAGATSSGTRGEPVAICLRQTVTTISDAVTGAVDATSLEERRLPSVLLRIFTVAPPPLEGEAACLPPIRT